MPAAHAEQVTDTVPNLRDGFPRPHSTKADAPVQLREAHQRYCQGNGLRHTLTQGLAHLLTIWVGSKWRLCPKRLLESKEDQARAWIRAPPYDVPGHTFG